MGLGFLRLVIAVFGLICVSRAEAPAVPQPVPQAVTRGVWLIQGLVVPDRQPDGNTVIFEAPQGLVVMDTGRHEWQRAAILTFARARKQPIVAVINSHWHLDHVSGNPALRAQYPDLRVYASDAIDRALTGFLASSAQENAEYVADARFPEATRADIRADLLTIQNGAALRPDVVIKTSAPVKLGGRLLEINLAVNAATAGDIWVYDPRSRVVATGDLVTLPAPYLDTACPEGWKLALAKVAATPFDTAIPGHGAPMTRAQFSLYQAAYGKFLECSSSADRAKEQCGASWAEAVRPLLSPGDAEVRRAQSTAEYYVALLRANGGRSRYCEAPREG